VSAATYVDERELIGEVLAGFTSAPMIWPGTEERPPEPSGNPESPVSYVVPEIEHDDVQMDFGGGAVIYGRLLLAVWAERDSGDYLVRQHVDALLALVAAGDRSGLTFLEPLLGPPQIGGANQEWYGRRLVFPFIRCR
jgi:hypothetical protein